MPEIDLKPKNLKIPVKTLYCIEKVAIIHIKRLRFLSICLIEIGLVLVILILNCLLFCRHRQLARQRQENLSTKRIADLGRQQIRNDKATRICLGSGEGFGEVEDILMSRKIILR